MWPCRGLELSVLHLGVAVVSLSVAHYGLARREGEVVEALVASEEKLDGRAVGLHAGLCLAPSGQGHGRGPDEGEEHQCGDCFLHIWHGFVWLLMRGSWGLLRFPRLPRAIVSQ